MIAAMFYKHRYEIDMFVVEMQLKERSIKLNRDLLLILEEEKVAFYYSAGNFFKKNFSFWRAWCIWL